MNERKLGRAVVLPPAPSFEPDPIDADWEPLPDFGDVDVDVDPPSIKRARHNAGAVLLQGRVRDFFFGRDPREAAVIARGRCGAVIVVAAAIAQWASPLREGMPFPSDGGQYVWYGAGAIAVAAVGFYIWCSRAANGPFSARLIGKALLQIASAVGLLLLAAMTGLLGNRSAGYVVLTAFLWLGAAGTAKLMTLPLTPSLREVFRR